MKIIIYEFVHYNFRKNNLSLLFSFGFVARFNAIYFGVGRRFRQALRLYKSSIFKSNLNGEI